jgi:hypothetical protein
LREPKIREKKFLAMDMGVCVGPQGRTADAILYELSRKAKTARPGGRAVKPDILPTGRAQIRLGRGPAG